MRTFILRVQDERDDRAVEPRLRGVVDEVATGSRVTFRSADELVRALLGSVGARPDLPTPAIPHAQEPHPDTDHIEKEI